MLISTRLMLDLKRNLCNCSSNESFGASVMRPKVNIYTVDGVLVVIIDHWTFSLYPVDHDMSLLTALSAKMMVPVSGINLSLMNI